MHKIFWDSLGFRDTRRSLNPGQKSKPRDNKKKKKKEKKKERKKTCSMVGFDVPADHRNKIKESEKK